MNSIPTIPPLPSHRPTASSVKTVLVVDDFEPLCDLVAHHLSKAGFHVLTASDAQRAQKIVESSGDSKIDLLLADAEMPDASGWQLVEWFSRVRPEGKVILMSRDEILPARNRGGVLQKPFSWANLGSAIREAFASNPVMVAA